MNLNINTKQLEAINSEFGPIMVVAGAGSGKTYVLTQRILHLITNLNFNPNKILAFTFTNKAANEIKKRVSTVISNFYFKWIGTFHSICLKILREDSHVINRANNFLVIDEDDQLLIIKEIYLLENFSKDKLSVKKCLSIVLKLKSLNLYEREEIFDYLEKTEYFNSKDIIATALIEYRNYLEKKNYFDFDDLIKNVNKIFSKDINVLEKWKARFLYILVDEFQDTNYEQFELINFLVGKNENIFVVGDPDQMIYSWRGADSNIFNNFIKKYPKNLSIVLEQNYRSSQIILDVSNTLIKNNQKRIEKTLYTKNSIGNKVIYFDGSNSDSESKWISDKIDFLINGLNYKYSDIAILYRSNYLSRNIEQYLFRRNIPYIVFGGLKFYRRKEIKDIISYLKYISIDDDVSLTRIYNVPKRKFSSNTYDEITRYAKNQNISTHEALTKHLEKIDKIGSAAKNACKNFNEIISKIKNFKYLTISDLIDFILLETKYKDYLDSEDENYRLENINELKNSINIYQQENPNSTLYDYLQEISLYADGEENIKDNNYITLMTVHSAKGLEFKNIFILGFNEDIFPSSKSIESDEIEEERRIAYVAMTRARENLFISSCRGFNFQKNNEEKIPSRFVKEIAKCSGLELIQEKKFFSQNFLSNKNDFFNHDTNKNNYHSKDVFFEIGDLVIHSVFKKGIVTNVFPDKLTIAFQAPYGVKNLMKNHKSITKIKQE